MKSFQKRWKKLDTIYGLQSGALLSLKPNDDRNLVDAANAMLKEVQVGFLK